jgi:hypothetical protein
MDWGIPILVPTLDHRHPAFLAKAAQTFASASQNAANRADMNV